LKNEKSVAVVHEWWAEFGGAENVVSQMINSGVVDKCWVLFFESQRAKEIYGEKINESWLRRLPLKDAKRLKVALSPLVYRSLTLKRFDLVILSSHSFAHTTKFPNDSRTTYLSYVYTPSRSIWLPEIDSRIGLGRANRRISNLLQQFDKKFHGHVDSFVSVSKTVQERLVNFWGIDSEVIYPPVDLQEIRSNLDVNCNPPFPRGQYLISAGRFVDYKRHDFSLLLAQYLKMPIVVMGAGPEEARLRMIAREKGINAKFSIAPGRKAWINLLANAHSLIFPNEEDFGIVPLESIAVGTPVIALNKGGAREYVIDHKNGRLVSNLELDSWKHCFNNQVIRDKIEINSIQNFDSTRFNKEFSDWVGRYT